MIGLCLGLQLAFCLLLCDRAGDCRQARRPNAGSIGPDHNISVTAADSADDDHAVADGKSQSGLENAVRIPASPNCFTSACRMAAAQFFSVCLRCESDQHAGQVGKVLSRGRMRYRTASNSRRVGASLGRVPTTPLQRSLVQVPCAQILKVLFQCHQIQPARKSEASRADHEPDIRIPFFGKHRRTDLVLVPIFDDVCLLFDVV